MGLVYENENILAGIELRWHVTEFVDHGDDDTAIILAFLVQQLVERGDAVGVRHVGHADGREILQQLIFQLIAVDHEQDGRLLRFVRPEEKFCCLNHRVGFAASLRVPDKSARAFRIESAGDDLVDRCRLMLAQNDLLQFLLFLREDNEVFQEAEQVGHVTEALDLRLKITDLIVLPVEDVSPHGAPCHAVGKAYGLRGGEDHLRHHHFRRFRVVTADLVHTQGDCFILAGVFALDDQHRNAVDQKNHILARSVMTVVDVKLLGDFIDVLPIFALTGEIAVIDERQIQLATFLGAEELSLVAEIYEKIAVAGDVSVEPPEFTYEGALGFLVFRVKGTDLGVQQISKIGRGRPGAVFRRRPVSIETPPCLSLGARHIAPADLLRVMQDAGLDGLVFSGSGHG